MNDEFQNKNRFDPTFFTSKDLRRTEICSSSLLSENCLHVGVLEESEIYSPSFRFLWQSSRVTPVQKIGVELKMLELE